MSYDEHDTQSPYRQAQIMWATLAFSIVVYVILAVLLNIFEAPFHGFVELSPTTYQLMRAFFIAISIAVIPLTPWVLKHTNSTDTSQSPIATRAVLAMAFSEIPAILALLSYLMTARIPEFAGGLALTAVLSAYYFPRPGGPTDFESNSN